MAGHGTITRWDALKLAGLALMFIDHAGYFYYTDQEWIRGIGRACAPIFLFLAGFVPHYKKDAKLIGLALLLTAFDWWMKGTPNTLNILWSILIIRALFYFCEKRGINAPRLHEWVIGAVFLLPSVILFQFGSLGVLFALSGYAYKHRVQYAATTPQRFLLFTTVFYGIAIALLSQFTPLTAIVMTASLVLMYKLLLWFTVSPMATIGHSAILKTCSRHTAIIYVAHLILLIGLTGKSL